jgi:hypothetical protein
MATRDAPVVVDQDLPPRLRDQVVAINPQFSPVDRPRRRLVRRIDDLSLSPEQPSLWLTALYGAAATGIGAVGFFLLGWHLIFDIDLGALGLSVLSLLLMYGLLGPLAIETRADRCLRRAHGHYVGYEDLDPQLQGSLATAQHAIRVILNSRVQAADLLDATGNRVSLPRLEWEIATTLRDLGPLLNRARYSDTVRSALIAALDRVSRRVEALDAYADHVRAADAAYVSRALGDGLAGDELERLTQQAQIAAAVLTDSTPT